MAGTPEAPQLRDTTDLRSGAPVHDALLAFVPLIGVWRGTGVGIAPATGEQFHFGQEIRFGHDGRPFVAYEARSWLLDSDGALIRLAWREAGFWRPGARGDDLEVVLASHTGEALVFTGTAGDDRWELATSSAVAAPTAKPVDGEKRLYALRGGQLVYVTELAPQGRPYAPHLNAELKRG
jgi:hypothetical protein